MPLALPVALALFTLIAVPVVLGWYNLNLKHWEPECHCQRKWHLVEICNPEPEVRLAASDIRVQVASATQAGGVPLAVAPATQVGLQAALNSSPKLANNLRSNDQHHCLRHQSPQQPQSSLQVLRRGLERPCESCLQ